MNPENPYPWPQAPAAVMPPQTKAPTGLVIALISVSVVAVVAVAVAIGAVVSSAGRESRPPLAVTAPTHPSTTPPSKPKGPVQAAIGEKITLQLELGQEFTIGVSAMQPGLKPTSQYAPPAKNGAFASVRVEMNVDKSRGSVMANPIMFKLVYADGTAVPSTPGISLPGSHLETVNLTDGQKAAGDVYFDLDPAKLAGAKVEFDYQSSATAFWAL